MRESGCTPDAKHCTLAGDSHAPASARRFVRKALEEWTGKALPATTAENLLDDAVLLVSELVTNAVIHAGTTIQLGCHLENINENVNQALVVEVSDHHPTRPPVPGELDTSDVHGRGLQLVKEIAQSWGVSYDTGAKIVWFRICPPTTTEPAVTGSPQQNTTVPAGHTTSNDAVVPHPRYALEDLHPTWDRRATLSFLAEASELLCGQFDEDKVAVLAGQLLVPRFAQWVAVWLESGPPEHQERRLRVWHTNEKEALRLRNALTAGTHDLQHQAKVWPVQLPIPPWLDFVDAYNTQPTGIALSCQLIASGHRVGTLVLGHVKNAHPDAESTALIADFARRLALVLAAARRYTQHADTSRVLQQGLLPEVLASVPNMDTHLVYEPVGDVATAGGDFYDLFRTHDGRWCFVLGDVCGHGPEAAIMSGLVRPLVRVIAEDGCDVPKVLNRLNRALFDDAASIAETAPAGRPPLDWQEVRPLSLLYGELVPRNGGTVHCALASAGHPLPLLLRADGRIHTAAIPQMLLGITYRTAYEFQSFTFSSGDALLCVTDGVTERRRGGSQFDDDEGLLNELARCVGLGAAGIAEQIRHAVHAFSTEPPTDDLAILTLRAR
ncbi:SpoIIE family protein phosphatase [Streptomyces sp. NPDC055709]